MVGIPSLLILSAPPTHHLTFPFKIPASTPDAEDLDIVMPMYNLLEYNDNYSMTSGSLWDYYRDKINDDENENDDDDDDNNNNNKILNKSKTITSKSFKHKAKIIGSTADNENRLNAEVVVPLKYLSNFWRSLDLPLVDCEMELDLPWTRYCKISEISRTFGLVPNTNPARCPVNIANNFCNISNK